MNRINRKKTRLLLIAAALAFPVAAAQAPRTEAVLNDLSPARRALDLDGKWRLTYGPVSGLGDVEKSAPPAEWPTIPATVPGNVELDLMEAGKLPDLAVGNHIYETRKLESYQWWYRREFESPRLEPGEHAELVFDGLDCLGTVWLNGQLAGRTANMLIAHRLDVTSLLRVGAPNTLVVRIDPAVMMARRISAPPGEYASEGHWESLGIRKAPHMYGWDIMPRLVSAGLWRSIRLEVTAATHLQAPYWATYRSKSENQAGRALRRLGDRYGPHRPRHSAHGVTLRRHGKIVLRIAISGTEHARPEVLNLKDVDLWWPRGYGDPALYDAELALTDSQGKLLDRRTARVGVRTVELQRRDISGTDAGDFAFVVNGERIFVKGTNWVPLDALHSRDLQQLERVFPLLTDLNCNMVRCWGGNVYESDRFFDLCDESGILVWQDFALACALYPQTNWFYEAMRTEAEAVIERLRNHPSLAMWAGSNETDEVPSWIGLEHLDPNLDRITRKVLPEAVRRFDPRRAYLPSSPYRSPELFAAGNDPRNQPEVHLWGPRGYFKAPYYTDLAAHFVSEIGYHGCPSRSSLEQMMDPQFVNPWVRDHTWNDEWLTKSVRSQPLDSTTRGRNDFMLKQIRAFMGDVPESLDDFILASQVTQAEAMKFFVESWRQQKGRRWGILWWNLRDGWPLISDSVVDYYNRPKLAYSYIREAQRDVQAICGETEGGRHPVFIVNDTLKPVHGRVRVLDLDRGAALLEVSFEVPANGRVQAGSIPHPERPEMWRLEWDLAEEGRYASHYLAIEGVVKFSQYREWMKKLAIDSPK